MGTVHPTVKTAIENGNDFRNYLKSVVSFIDSNPAILNEDYSGATSASTGDYKSATPGLSVRRVTMTPVAATAQIEGAIDNHMNILNIRMQPLLSMIGGAAEDGLVSQFESVGYKRLSATLIKIYENLVERLKTM